MKNKIFLIIIFFKLLFCEFVYANDQFIFDITEVEILNNGNLIKGNKQGVVKTNDGLTLEAEKFEYNKVLNILEAKGNVKINDPVNRIKIFSDEITYLKNDEKIFTNKNSKAIYEGTIITAENFEYNKILNILNASNKVKIVDEVKNYLLFTESITYLKNKEKIFTEGKTKTIIDDKFTLYSNETIFLRDKNIVSSKTNAYVTEENERIYQFDQFEYLINEDILKAKNVEIVSDNLLNNGFSDIAKFKEGFFNIKEKNYIAGYSEFKLKKDTLGPIENDPRLVGVSSSKKNNIIEVNKGLFTSCSKNRDCPSWSIKAKKIKHDANKRQLIYDDAVLNIYNKPVFYFPKFFHPDPSVERQSGILQPAINDSDILGSSFHLPYFYVISKSKDLTIKPTFFEDSMYMLQNEYRQINENSSLIADFNLLQNYKPTLSNNKKSVTHLFSKYKLDLNFENFTSSTLDLSLQKVSNDNYLKVFDNNLINMKLKPSSKSNLESAAILNLNNENFDFDGGIKIYDNLQETKNSDRYQYVFPYYNFSKAPIELKYGIVNFHSIGDSRLINTNNLKSKIVNDINYENFEIISNFGFKNNLNAYFKNVNRLSKKDQKFKSSPQAEIKSIYEVNTSLPLSKIGNQSIDYLIPKISFRFNPSDMDDISSSSRNINADNIFGINRLGLDETFETGKSLTIGLDYKKENLFDINKYFEFKLGSVLRDKHEDKISKTSTIQKKSSNIFGSLNTNFTDFLKFEYDFSIDNDFSTIENNTIKTILNHKNFITEFNFTETNGELGDLNILSNITTINFDDNNFLKFQTRRNRKISLTEYYDLVYEYKNDCLSAAIKYKKTYYEDRELKPKEDLVLSLTIFPITTYEHEVDQSVYRGPNSINDLFDDL